MKFRKGDKMFWKNSNTPAYEKVGDNDFDWWVSLDSKYLVETVHELRPETEKPLYRKDGTLNRFGFKWTDDQVYEYYKSFMNFVTN